MAGYTRQSSSEIVDDATVEAAPLNAELNQLQSAFNATNGHVHDGSTGNAPKVSLTGSVSGILPVVNGGSGLATITSGKVMVGAGTGVVNLDKAAPTGDFVGTSDTQTLTSKTLTAPTITGATISTSTLSGTFTGTVTSSSATITGGSISGITDLAVADGGTGASTAAAARTNLGLGTMATKSSDDYVTTATYSAADILTKLKTVDGAGSGLDADTFGGHPVSYFTASSGAVDADTLDTHDSSYFTNASNLNAGTVPSARLSGTYGIDISGDAATLNGQARTAANTVNTVVSRDSSGDISCRLLRSEYPTTSATIEYIMTQQAVGTSNNYVRPSTPAQLAAALSGLINATTLDGLNSSQFLRSDTSDTINGRLTVGSYVQTNGSILILAGNGGNVYLRPNGPDTGSGQTYINTAGTLVAAGNVGAFSDVRLKTDIKTLEGSLDRVNQMRGVSFIKDGQPSIGVIAQEMEQVRPEVVEESEYREDLGFAPKTVAYGNLAAELIEAVKELTGRVKQLEAQVQDYGQF